MNSFIQFVLDDIGQAIQNVLKFIYSTFVMPIQRHYFRFKWDNVAMDTHFASHRGVKVVVMPVPGMAGYYAYTIHAAKFPYSTIACSDAFPSLKATKRDAEHAFFFALHQKG